MSEKQRTRHSCSFCGKHRQEVGKLVAGPRVDICDECVRMCMKIVQADPGPKERIDDPRIGGDPENGNSDGAAAHRDGSNQSLASAEPEKELPPPPGRGGPAAVVLLADDAAAAESQSLAVVSDAGVVTALAAEGAESLRALLKRAYDAGLQQGLKLGRPRRGRPLS